MAQDHHAVQVLELWQSSMYLAGACAGAPPREVCFQVRLGSCIASEWPMTTQMSNISGLPYETCTVFSLTLQEAGGSS